MTKLSLSPWDRNLAAGFFVLAVSVAGFSGPAYATEGESCGKDALTPGIARQAADKGIFEMLENARSHQARFAGDLVNMENIRRDLEMLTGVTPIAEGVTIGDRYTDKNRDHTRKFIQERLRDLGYQTYEERFTPRGGHEEDGDDDEDGDYGSSSHSSSSKPSSDGPAVNIFAEIRGSEKPNEVIEINAHYDTVHHDVPGADDNGSGLTTVLEMARVFRQLQPKRTVRFMFADLEEKGYQGTGHHVDALKARGEMLKGALVIDMIGYAPKPTDSEWVLEVGELYNFSDGSGANTRDAAHAGTRAMAEAILYQFHRYSDRTTKIRPDVFSAKPGTADHGPYWRAGYPALLAAAPYEYTGNVVNPNYHKKTDGMHAINWAYFSDIVRSMTEGVACLSGSTAACEVHQALLAEKAPKHDALAVAEIVPTASRLPTQRPVSTYSFGYGGPSSSAQEPLRGFLSEEEALKQVARLTALSPETNRKGVRALKHANPRYESVALELIEITGGRYRMDAKLAAEVLTEIKFVPSPAILAKLNKMAEKDIDVSSKSERYATYLIAHPESWTLTPEEAADGELLSQLTLIEDLTKFPRVIQQEAKKELIAKHPTSPEIIEELIHLFLTAEYVSEQESAEEVLRSLRLPLTAKLDAELQSLAGTKPNTNRYFLAKAMRDHSVKPE